MDSNFIKRQYKKDETFRLKSFKGNKLTGYQRFQIALDIEDKKLDLDTAERITQRTRKELILWKHMLKNDKTFADKGGRPQITTEDFRAEMLELVTTCDDEDALKEKIKAVKADHKATKAKIKATEARIRLLIKETEDLKKEFDASRRKAEKKLEWAQHSERPASEDGDTAGGRSKRRRTKKT